MNRNKFCVSTMLVLLISVILTVDNACGSGISVGSDKPVISDQSLKLEVQHSIELGLGWLKKAQQPGGYWSQAEYPALTGLVLIAFMGEPTSQMKAGFPDFISKGYEYLLSNVQPDGGIYFKELANYNTAVCVMALAVANNPAYEPVLRKARNFIVAEQSDFDKQGVPDSPFDGGVGYGGKYQHSDMSNTMFALEALYYTKFMNNDIGPSETKLKELNWAAAIKFIERCQNLPETNDQPWASDDPQNKGGFIYFPGDSKAGEMELASGKKALRSYASISYAGMLSYAYADLKKDDPRVTAVIDWLQKNYTLEENPGMGQEGLFYYYHTMAKALTAYGVDELVLANGDKVNWRKELALKLLNLQKADGMWMNENGRWWEKDPNLVTAYAVIVLDIIHRGL